MTDATTISVCGDATYDITVGRGILSSLGEALPPAARKVLVIHPPTLAAQGLDRLHLDVHRDNHRAQGAYRRAGFAPTGETLTGPIGPEIVMARPLP